MIEPEKEQSVMSGSLLPISHVYTSLNAGLEQMVKEEEEEEEKEDKEKTPLSLGIVSWPTK